MLPLYLYNTLTRQKDLFTPLKPAEVTLYVCGPTVYDYAHIGNARPVVVFDVLFRLLNWLYPNVRYARNITDIDDKIITACAEQGLPMESLTRRFELAFREDMFALNALPPTLEPRATEHLPQMLALIDTLIKKGHAYVADGHVLFDVASFPAYAALSRRSAEDRLAGARVEVAAYKKNPEDFVLWKPSAPDQPGWDSPHSRGRPGWHLECSAMIAAHLGTTIDIHGGGNDLIFPHHENEIAQSVCAHDNAPLARFWLHNGFITVNGQKMSKSLGNFKTVRELRGEHSPEAMRWLLLSAHYRQPLDWTDEGLKNARQNLDKFYGVLRESESEVVEPLVDDALFGALCDDLNTPAAFARLHELAADFHKSSDAAVRRDIKRRLTASGLLLGILQQDAETWFQGGNAAEAADIESLIAQRAAARARKDFQTSDMIRDGLLARGIVLEDKAGQTVWKRA
ncbi:MAG: cysteine--tRNA ligase [Alphaproteobacteria bacterium]|jgi:cysteinyl-tRNA synthetase|nr:cysteine--tRNA ligase [Alphaproteobacteria bacterium]